jgi:hypothetical protein
LIEAFEKPHFDEISKNPISMKFPWCRWKTLFPQNFHKIRNAGLRKTLFQRNFQNSLDGGLRKTPFQRNFHEPHFDEISKNPISTKFPWCRREYPISTKFPQDPQCRSSENLISTKFRE